MHDLRKSVRRKSLPMVCLPKKRKVVSSKLGDGLPEENKEAEKRKSFDPFVDVYYDCEVTDCQDCKELELL